MIPALQPKVKSVAIQILRFRSHNRKTPAMMLQLGHGCAGGLCGLLGFGLLGLRFRIWGLGFISLGLKGLRDGDRRHRCTC